MVTVRQVIELAQEFILNELTHSFVIKRECRFSYQYSEDGKKLYSFTVTNSKELGRDKVLDFLFLDDVAPEKVQAIYWTIKSEFRTPE